MDGFYRGDAMRIYDRLFCISPEYKKSSKSIYNPLNLVRLSNNVSNFLADQAFSSSYNRGGLLFGYYDEDVLQIVLASSSGSVDWYPAGQREIIDVDNRFILGWSEAMAAVFNSKIDWIGNWFVYNDSLLGDIDRDFEIFHSGVISGIFDDRSILLIVGFSDEGVKIRIYNRLLSGYPRIIPYDLNIKDYKELLINLFDP